MLGLLAIAGCGSSSNTPPGLVISGPGLQASEPASGLSQPPWPPEYAHLAERLKQIGIPPGGQEKFHIHAILRIYINGQPVASSGDLARFYQQFATTSVINAEIQRGSQTLQVSYSIQP